MEKRGLKKGTGERASEREKGIVTETLAQRPPASIPLCLSPSLILKANNVSLNITRLQIPPVLQAAEEAKEKKVKEQVGAISNCEYARS